MITLDEEEKVRQAVIRMKTSSEAIRRAQTELAIALSDIRYDANLIGQFVPHQEAYLVRNRAEKMIRNLNGLELGSLTVKADRLSEDAWENRLDPKPKKDDE